MDWQPISTAPMDGTRVLLCEDGDVSIGKYNYYGEWEDEFYAMCDTGPLPSNPTHWMPLPNPPQQE